MKKILTGLILLGSLSALASTSFESKVERYNMLVQAGKITTQDFSDLISALNPKQPVEVKKESREERVQRWESLLESGKINGQDYRDLVDAQNALEE